MRKIYSLLLLGGLLLFGAQNVWALSEGDNLYFNAAAQSYWRDASAVLNVVFINGSTTSTETAAIQTVVTNNNIYVVTVPEGTWTKVKLTRNNPSGGTIWNETGEIDIPSKGNYIHSFTAGSGEATWGGFPFVLKGTFNEWSGTNDIFSDADYTVTVRLTAGSDVELKVYNHAEESWYGVGDGAAKLTSNNCTEWELTGENNVVMTPSTTGDYIFKWEDSKFSVVFPTYPITLSPAAADGYGYASFFLPVAVTIPSGVNAYYQSSSDLSSGTSVTVNFTKITSGVIPASTPVILRGTASTSYSFAYNTSSATVSKDVLYKGVTKESNFSSGLEYNSGDYVYVLAGTGASFGFHVLNLSGHVNASRCYLVIPKANTPAQAPAINMLIEDENGITAIPVFGSENNVKDNTIYTILGQRVSGMSAPGVYIQAGKKIVVK